MAPVPYTASTAPEKKLLPAMSHTNGVNASNGRAPESQAALDDLTRRVREQSDKIQKMLSPYAETLKEFAEARPVLFTWLAIFSGLSAIPIMCTVGFVLAVTGFFVGTAVFILTGCIIATVVLSMVILVPILVFMGVLATMAVVVLLGLFLAHRLFLHLKAASVEHGISIGALTVGIPTWIEETSSRVGLGDGDYRPPFGDSHNAHDVHKHDVYKTGPAAADIKVDYDADAQVPEKLQPSKPLFGSEDARTPTLKSTATFSAPHVKQEPHDMFSPPQPAQHSLAPTDSRDSEWTSASDQEVK